MQSDTARDAAPTRLDVLAGEWVMEAIDRLLGVSKGGLGLGA
jgi:hypothetical protein